MPTCVGIEMPKPLNDPETSSGQGWHDGEALQDNAVQFSVICLLLKRSSWIIFFVDSNGYFTMTKLLEKAIGVASKLSKAEQDAIAATILDELADEERWTKTFTASQEQLARLAREARAEYKRGRTQPLDLSSK
jgi:hypothetical protein